MVLTVPYQVVSVNKNRRSTSQNYDNIVNRVAEELDNCFSLPRDNVKSDDFQIALTFRLSKNVSDSRSIELESETCHLQSKLLTYGEIIWIRSWNFICEKNSAVINYSIPKYTSDYCSDYYNYLVNAIALTILNAQKYDTAISPTHF